MNTAVSFGLFFGTMTCPITKYISKTPLTTLDKYPYEKTCEIAAKESRFTFDHGKYMTAFKCMEITK